MTTLHPIFCTVVQACPNISPSFLSLLLQFCLQVGSVHRESQVRSILGGRCPHPIRSAGVRQVHSDHVSLSAGQQEVHDKIGDCIITSV